MLGCGREDDDVSDAVRKILEMEVIRIPANAKCISLAKRDSGIAFGMECGEGPPEVVRTHVLLAVGRTPNTNDLGLTGPALGTRKIVYWLMSVKQYLVNWRSDISRGLARAPSTMSGKCGVLVAPDRYGAYDAEESCLSVMLAFHR
jgi:hypothetical protein